VIYTVRADEGEDLMDFVSNLDSKPRRKSASTGYYSR